MDDGGSTLPSFPGFQSGEALPFIAKRLGSVNLVHLGWRRRDLVETFAGIVHRGTLEVFSG